ncbi:thiol-disulfide oxidoreductase LTO1 isoform X1 [Physcomitrium patens]|uniref:Vitamin K epoxide reductase domain-containing protein n=2 Tax=Physcomitrium patens TaxID=3218 RepID=A0A2K1KWQ5_PHYPA|nr:thiol-disulfide oxidoreductase LTO1-like isoform X1 [Physcomitrium patens]XP_024370109.1 thiol-disulfide oxidoreductase LTO1-like isoform X1 [Physcomitrium patens]XP_024370110.1 thiol-disulfide oxidoreductase LTO1-like isoform X1 [Physcomitrium patens]XP_024370111.1 thiol-disulfide oxidoreductase LTO1-like isoform X1 [Physcomitrium patens]PNR58201.1 hypothetical protein PHYPA_005196 [Physcomitrium patens]|eukprot:XP_024370108.1 thiol-disulfide oxidoreductase LTO1-like isoform X1 [Physcomitrella patens]
MEIVNYCVLSSAPAIRTGKVSNRMNFFRNTCTLNPFYNSRHLLVETKRCDQQRMRLHRSLYVRAQTPSPSNDDNQVSPEITSSKNVDNLEDEVRRVRNSPAGEPSKLRYGLITGLATAGLVETAYLTWMKLQGGPVSCPLGGTGCDDVLNSKYGTIFGVPLSLVGMLAYGTVTLLASRMATNPKDRFIEEEGLVKWLLLASTTVMGVASTYFMYILNDKLGGASCTYCVGSAILSISLLLCTLVSFNPGDLRNVAGIQLTAGVSVALVLSAAFNDIDSASFRSGDIDIPYESPEVTHVSNAKEIALAKQLKAIGAKMYGAFWCSHCFEQKQMLGKEAVKYLEYVECYPEGYRSGVKIAKECDEINIQGFPTWVINGQQYSGELEFEKLVELSGLSTSESAQ